MDSLYPHAQDSNPSVKCCSKCKRDLPATTEYYHRNKYNKDGFQYYCKQCKSIAQPKEIPPDGCNQCSQCKRMLPATSEYFGHHKEYRGRKARFDSQCRQCKAKADKAYVARNKEQTKLRKGKYNAEHREQRKIYDAEHKERIESLRKIHREVNKERLYKQRKQYYEKYYKSEHGRIQMRASSNNRRARKRNAVGKHTAEELHQQLSRQKNKCYYCQKKLGKQRNNWVAEHVIPLAKGGSNTIDNIVVACPDCNLKKGSKLLHEWTDGGRLL